MSSPASTDWTKREPGLRHSRFGPLLVRLYGLGGPRVKRWIQKIAQRQEGGAWYSAALRQILAKYHGVRVGAYSYGACLFPGHFPAGVTIGRYCSIASHVQVFRRNHPYERLSTHPFFYNDSCGFLDADTVGTAPLEIGHDVWVGYGAIILPRCVSIGLGAIVGAGSVVTKDVPEFTVVAGNPARVIRRRFDEPVCERVRQSRWWWMTVEAIADDMALFTRPLDAEALLHPLLTGSGRGCNVVRMRS